ncbi:MAG: lamin tail domain-containing protein, partial [Verrucomicrobia subdivision 3 bacterium]|nr:lamin tail domain-containing protein [Limisphaerales bacterium]
MRTLMRASGRLAGISLFVTLISADLCRAAFTPADIGNPAIAGTFTEVADGYDIVAGGTNIFGNADQFSFYYQEMAGDFDVRVRIASLSLSDAWAKAGLMARETAQARSRFAGAFATPNISGAFFQSRAGTNQTTYAGQFPVNYPNTWLRLRRVGSALTGYAGIDGQNWSQMGTLNMTNVTGPLLVGLATVSANASRSVRAEYRDYGDATGGTIASVRLPIEPLGPSSRKTGLIISEIMYHPRHSNDLEFVELFNADLINEDLGGYRLSGAIAYTFPSNTVLRAGEFIVVARTPPLLEAAYGISGVLGPWLGDDGNVLTNALPDDEGTIRLRNRSGAVLLEVNYEGGLPWPVAADGAGHSLVLTHPSFGEDDFRAWAASAYIGGSPGRLDSVDVDRLSSIVINEFLANSPDPVEDFIELYNHSNETIDLSGAWLSDDRDTNKFRIPTDTMIDPRGFIHFNQSTLGFALSSAGERIYLVNSNQTRVIDTHAFEAQALGVSSGRFPDGGEAFQELATRAPGAANSAPLAREIVINEIMYNPVSRVEDEEYLELFNRGTNSVDVSNWRFTDGIDFRIPSGAVIPAGGFLVVAKNAQLLRSKYPQLSAGNTVGNYGGSLANGGERIALSMPEYVFVTNGATITTNANYIVIDEVVYVDGGRWGPWSDGGGSSLELIDPDSDNRLAANWGDSDETAKSEWITVNHRELLDHVYPRGGAGATLNEVQIMILGAGEALIDDIEVHSETPTTGPNLVTNGDFANGLAGWVIQGNHLKSGLEPAGPNNPSQSLRIRASGGGDNGANRVEKDLTSILPANATASVRARLRWLRGHPDVLLRFHGGGMDALVSLPLPTNLGSPGLVNSRRLENAGPAIYDVAHQPGVPAANEPVVVTARIDDPDGISAVTLQYRTENPVAALTSVPMLDDGTGGDALAGDGIYSVTLSGFGAGRLVAFRIQAMDGAAGPATLFPHDAPTRECLIRFGDATYSGSIGVYRLWMTSANIAAWTAREKLSNEALDGTMVYNNYRIIYNAGARWRGSPFIRPNYTTPTGVACGYVWVVPEDDLLFGEDEMNLDSLEPTSRDSTALREITSFTILEQLGLPSSYQRFMHVVINGITDTSRGIPVYTDSQQPNADYIESWFPDDSDGEIYKIDDWFEFDDSVARQVNKCASLQNFVTAGGVKKKARYRWNWEKKFNRGRLDDDYSSLFASVDAINAPDSSIVREMESMFQLEEYLTALAFRHVVGDWDGYGYNRGKNQFTYRPPGGKFWMLMWDLDFALGCGGGHPPTQNLFEVNTQGDSGENHMPEIARIYNNPYFRRIYLRGLQRMANGPLQDANFLPILDARYRALVASGVNTVSPYVASGAQSIGIDAWIRQRRANILGQIPNANFAVTSTNNVTATNNLVTITGTAPIAVKTIQVNGQDYPVTWTSVTAWTLRLVVTGDVTLSLQGLDLARNPITPINTVNITYTGSSPSPEGVIAFNEIMYNPQTPEASFVEIYNSSTNFAFDLSNWRVNGLDFTFPFGTILTNRQIIVLAKNRTAFSTAYGSSVGIFGQFDGNLDPDGETISLIRQGTSPEEDLIVDRVRYEPGPPWPSTANGGGPSLQLVDAAQDNARVSNWSDGSGWRFYSFTANLNPSTNQFRFYLAAIGQIYVDNISLVAGPVPEVGQNLILNGDFEGPFHTNDGGPWSFSQPSLSNTVVSADFVYAGNGSLRLVHQIPGPSTFLVQNGLVIPTAGEYTMSLWFFPITNNTTLTLYVNSTYRPTFNVRAVLSTPGAVNSAAATLPPYPPLWLNELQANNITGVRDTSNTAEPWL